MLFSNKFYIIILVPEWQLPLEEDEPPDNESALYNKGTGDVYTENLALARLQQKQGAGAFDADSKNRERKNSASSAANLISLTQGSLSSNDVDGNTGQLSSLSGSHNSASNAINQIAQPPPLTTSHPPSHLIHDDMEMCSDEDDETTKDPQFDNFAYSNLEQGMGTAGNVHAPHLLGMIPPLMSEEEFNKFKYHTENQNNMVPPLMDNPPPTAGPFSNPPPSLSIDQTRQSQFPPVPSTPPGRVNPYLRSTPRELTDEEKEEEKRTQSLQDRLRNLAGVPVDKDEGNVQSAHINAPLPPYSAPNGQEKCNTMGNSFNHGGRGSSHRGSPGVNYNEFRGGHIGGPPFGGPPRAMMRPHVPGSWRGGPRNGLPMRGMRGSGRSRPVPRW